MARRLTAAWLMADGVWTALWFSGLAQSLGGRDAVSVTAIGARLLVAALSVASGWLISQRRPAGAPLGTAALLLLAAFSVIDASTAVLPSNLDPSFRWPAAWLHATGAAVGILLLRREKM